MGLSLSEPVLSLGTNKGRGQKTPLGRSVGASKWGPRGTPSGPCEPAWKGDSQMFSELKHQLSGEACPCLQAWSCLLVVCLVEPPASSQLPYETRPSAGDCGHCCLVGCRGHCPLRWKKKVGHGRAAASVVSTHPLCPCSGRSEEKTTGEEGLLVPDQPPMCPGFQAYLSPALPRAAPPSSQLSIPSFLRLCSMSSRAMHLC